MVCSFCHAEWEFRPIVCPGCGEENDKMLPVLTASEFDSIRVECCEASKTYIKRVELTKNGRADPMVDELSSAPFDLWAREHDYTKLQKNQPQFRQRCGSTISASEAGRAAAFQAERRISHGVEWVPQGPRQIPSEPNGARLGMTPSKKSNLYRVSNPF